MSEKRPFYESPGEKGKRGFEDLECYQLAHVTGNIAEAYGRYHYLDSLHYYSIARGELNETLAHLINARVLEYISPPDFESLYKLIRHAEQALNDFMSYVRRQRTGSQEYGNKKIGESETDYDVTLFDQEND